MAPCADLVVLGQYRLTHRLGEGAGGETWRAEPVDGGEPVAIKVVSHAGLRTRGTADLLREAAVLQGMRHPHIVRYLGVVDLPGSTSTFLIMEYVPGGNLAEWMQRRPPCSPHEAAPLVLQVANALSFLHGAGILHRDLKPANILVRPIPNALPSLLVADFGISRPLVGGLAPHTRPAGTPGYTPPETWSGQEVTTAADVFSLGALSWHLLTGAYPLPMPPRGAPDPAGLRELLQHQTGVSGSPINEITLRMLAEDPKLRPTLDEVRCALAASPPPLPRGEVQAALAASPARPMGGDWPTSSTLVAELGSRPLPENAAGERSTPPPLARPRGVASGRARAGIILGLGLMVASAALCAGLRTLGDGATSTASPAVPDPVPPGSPSVPLDPSDAPAVVATVSPGASTPAVVDDTPPALVNPPALSVPESSGPDTTQRISIERIVAPPTGQIAELRVGFRSPVGLPTDVDFVVTTAGGAAYRTPNTQLTLTGVRSGRATFELRTTTRALAQTTLDLPPAASVRVLCEALAADFSALSCNLR